MAYRGFKRVLGESSLERKCRWWFGIALAVLLVLTFLWSGQQLREIVRVNKKEVGPGLVAAAFTEKHLEYLTMLSPEEEAILPAEAASWRETIASLLESSRAIGSPENEETPFESYAIKPQDSITNPNAYGAPQFDYERKYLRQYELAKPGSEQAEPKSFATEDGSQWLYYKPIYAETKCLTCHKHNGKPIRPGLKEDDLIAVIRITKDHRNYHERLSMYEAIMWAIAVFIGFLSMFLLWAIVKLLIVKPVTHLREVANAVREGDTAQRADIQTGDEFEELAASFNRMLRQLLSQQDALEQVNTELDGKVDELAQMNLRLFEMNRLKSDFLATMSHELRTPLNSILGFSDVLATVDSLDPKQQRYVENIQRSGKMLLEMINDILDLAKLESGRMDASPSETSIATIVTAQCDMARPLAERKNIDLTASCPTDEPPLRQDLSKLQQILNNLLSNAIKFTPEGGRIMVRARREKPQVAHGWDSGSVRGTLPPLAMSGDAGVLLLEVEDTGIGISEADQAVIFEKFRQGASAAPDGDAMTREQGGTGLGLSIVRELCRLLGGDVSVRSVSGKGSTFLVRLPWRLSHSNNQDTELTRGVAELTRPTGATLPSPSVDENALTTN